MWVALLSVAAIPAAQAQRSEAEARLREMLRSTTVELRDAQNQNAELRSQLDELKAQRAPVEQKPSPAVDTAALRRAQQEASELRRTLAELRHELDEREQVIARWKQTSEQTAQLANARDADVKQFNQQQQVLSERIETCERNNAELVGIANEVLERYRNKGIWAAVRDNEPLLGIHRVKLETLAQQYHAQIVDRKIPSANEAQNAQSPR
jgi:DNA repair exonuclease SbcCD ATPase subunit